MILKSVEQTRLGFNTSKWWKIKFTSNNIEKDFELIKNLVEPHGNEVPLLYKLERENGFCVEPISTPVLEIIESLFK